MVDLEETKRILEEINAAVSKYDPILREKARDILLRTAFGTIPGLDSAGKEQECSLSAASVIDRREYALNALSKRWSPETIADLALLSAYHLQYIRGYRRLSGRQVRINLQRHGLQISNMSVALNQNTKAKPPRMKKRKVRYAKSYEYMVTTAGARYVEEKLEGENVNPFEGPDASVLHKP